VDAIFWNPAGLARNSGGTEAVFSHMSYIADIGVNYFAVGTSFEGFGSLGFSLKTLDIGDIEVTTADATEGTGEVFTPTYVTLGLTYSRQLTDRISVGFTTNLVSERIDRVSATGVAFNFGVQYTSFANVSGLAIGVAVKNIGPGMKFSGSGLLREATATDNLRPPAPLAIEAQSDELPSTIELGVSYQHQISEEAFVALSSVFQNNNMSDDDFKLGMEIGFQNTLFLRGGYVLSQESVPESHLYGLTLGAGVQYPIGGLDITFDYAYRYVKYFLGNHMFTVKLGF
jgi:hypothetical protein